MSEQHVPVDVLRRLQGIPAEKSERPTLTERPRNDRAKA